MLFSILQQKLFIKKLIFWSGKINNAKKVKIAERVPLKTHHKEVMEGILKNISSRPVVFLFPKENVCII